MIFAVALLLSIDGRSVCISLLFSCTVYGSVLYCAMSEDNGVASGDSIV